VTVFATHVCELGQSRDDPQSSVVPPLQLVRHCAFEMIDVPAAFVVAAQQRVPLGQSLARSHARKAPHEGDPAASAAPHVADVQAIPPQHTWPSVHVELPHATAKLAGASSTSAPSRTSMPPSLASTTLPSSPPVNTSVEHALAQIRSTSKLDAHRSWSRP